MYDREVTHASHTAARPTQRNEPEEMTEGLSARFKSRLYDSVIKQTCTFEKLERVEM